MAQVKEQLAGLKAAWAAEVAKVTAARIVSRITSGLRAAIHSRHSQSRFFSLATSLRPYSSKRAAASTSLKPDRDVPNRCNTAEASSTAASWVKSDAF